MSTITTVIYVLAGSCIILAVVELLGLNSRKKWDPRGRHCYVTGGTSGLGLALAVLLMKRGAHVSIVARNKERLLKAVEEIETARQTPDQLLNAYSYDVSDASEAQKALEVACKPYGERSPDAIFLCAGKSTPGFYVEQTEANLRTGMDNAYWVSAWTALAATKHMVANRSKGKVVFVSSILGYMSIVGYSSYSPAKWALRGLAETLRSELKLYSIDVHIYFPSTIYSPGYEQENKTKPKVTLKIEEADEGMNPDKCAESLLRGVQRGQFHITADLINDLFRTTTRGATPCNNYVLDFIYSLAGWVGITVWRYSVDGTVLAHAKEHEKYLSDRGWWPKEVKHSPVHSQKD